MARTTKSRGKTNFRLDNSPYPLFKGLRNAAKNIFNKTPVGMIANAIKGGGGGGEGGSIGERLDRIEQKLDQASSEAGSADAVIGGNQDIDLAELSANKAAKKAAQAAQGVDDSAEMLTKIV
tara:strand:- start:1035 stop:1400 length:366 start_codon:yes stop_codon:yes gene_type:complete